MSRESVAHACQRFQTTIERFLCSEQDQEDYSNHVGNAAQLCGSMLSPQALLSTSQSFNQDEAEISVITCFLSIKSTRV